MAQIINRLSAKEVDKITTPGMYADGAGLYLQVTSAGAKSWILRYSLAGRPREMGLGPLKKSALPTRDQKSANATNSSTSILTRSSTASASAPRMRLAAKKTFHLNSPQRPTSRRIGAS